MRVRTVCVAVALLVVAGVIAGVGPSFASATQTPHAATNERTAEARSGLAAVQTTTTATTRGEPPQSARIVARYPADNGSMVERTVLTSDGVARVDPPVNASRGPGWRVALTLTDAGAERFASTLVDAGFTENIRGCPTTDTRDDEGYCLLVLVDGEVTSASSLGPALARSIETGEFQDAPRFVLAAENESEAVAIWRGFLDAGTTAAAATTNGTGGATDDGTTSESGATGDTTTTSTGGSGAGQTGSTSTVADGTARDSTAGFGLVVAMVACVAGALALGRYRDR